MTLQRVTWLLHYHEQPGVVQTLAVKAPLATPQTRLARQCPHAFRPNGTGGQATSGTQRRLSAQGDLHARLEGRRSLELSRRRI